MREILFFLYILLFAVYIMFDPLLSVSVVPLILASYWLWKDDVDLERIYKEVERLERMIKESKS